MYRFYLTSKNVVTLKSGSKVTQGLIGNDTIRSASYDFLLTFHNHQPISHRFRYRRQFMSKKRKIFTFRAFNSPADWVTLGIGQRSKGTKRTRVLRLPDGR